MTMMDERDIRAQLERAVEVIEPLAPPLDSLRARGRRRSRVRRTGWGVIGIAATAAIVLIAVLVLSGSGGNQSLKPANRPSRASLVNFAAENHALKHIAGPYEGSGGDYFGAFTTKAGIIVAKYRGSAWRQDGATITALGSGQWIMRLAFRPDLDGAGPPAVYLRQMGGDITYAGSFLRRINGQWTLALFGPCGHHNLCPVPGNAQPYLHQTTQGLISVNNTCRPDCAAGNEFTVTWTWNAPAQKFVATKAVRYVP